MYGKITDIIFCTIQYRKLYLKIWNLFPHDTMLVLSCNLYGSNYSVIPQTSLWYDELNNHFVLGTDILKSFCFYYFSRSFSDAEKPCNSMFTMRKVYMFISSESCKIRFQENSVIDRLVSRSTHSRSKHKHKAWWKVTIVSVVHQNK